MLGSCAICKLPILNPEKVDITGAETEIQAKLLIYLELHFETEIGLVHETCVGIGKEFLLATQPPEEEDVTPR